MRAKDLAPQARQAKVARHVQNGSGELDMENGHDRRIVSAIQTTNLADILNNPAGMLYNVCVPD